MVTRVREIAFTNEEFCSIQQDSDFSISPRPLLGNITALI